MFKPVDRIKQLIFIGENEQLDFKQTIADAYKIAKTISAFANANGGRLLIGVKDNKSICGIKTDEEKYMIDMAATMYCKPAVAIEYIEHEIEKKTILECIVIESETKPVFALDIEKKWTIYCRENDKTHKAGLITFEILKQNNFLKAPASRYSNLESDIIKILNLKEKNSLKDLLELSNFKKRTLIKCLVNLVKLNLVKINHHNEIEYFSLIK